MPPAKDPETGKFVSTDQTPDPAKVEKPPEPTMTDETKKDITDWVEEAIGVKPGAIAKEAPKAKADKPKAPAKPRVAPKPAAIPAVPLTADQIAEAAARGAASAFVNKDKKTEEKADENTATLTPAQERKISVLERMEKIQPERYKGAATKYRENAAKLAAYAAEWEKLNPGQTFDGESDEHRDFFDSNELYDFWEPEDYTEAVADLRAEKNLQDQQVTLNERLSAFERREKLAEKAPEINAERNAGAHFFFTALGRGVFPDLVDGEGVPVMEKVHALIASDDEVKAEFNALGDDVAELYKVVNGLEPVIEKEPQKFVNGQANPKWKQWQTQRDLADFFTEKERLMASNPAEKRRDGDGRDFLPSAEYYRRIKVNREETQHLFWTYSVRELTALRALEFAKKIAAQEDSRRQWAERRGVALPNKPQVRQQPSDEQPDGSLDDGDGKPLSPGTAGLTRMAATRSKGVKTEKSGIEGWVESGIAGS